MFFLDAHNIFFYVDYGYALFFVRKLFLDCKHISLSFFLAQKICFWTAFFASYIIVLFLSVGTFLCSLYWLTMSAFFCFFCLRIVSLLVSWDVSWIWALLVYFYILALYLCGYHGYYVCYFLCLFPCSVVYACMCANSNASGVHCFFCGVF